MKTSQRASANIKSLHEKALETARNYIRLEKELLEIIIEIEKKKAYRRLGYSSLYTYVNEGLKISPSTSYNFIQVARKSIEVPALKEEVSSGRISISKAKKIAPVLNKENHQQWFTVAHSSTHRKLEREVALASPTQAVPEKVNYVPSTEKVSERVQVKRSVPRLAVQLGVSEKLMLKLRDVQNLESQRQKKNITLEETLEALTELYLEKKDPVRKAKRQKARGKLKPLSHPLTPTNAMPIGEKIKNAAPKSSLRNGKPQNSSHMQKNSSRDLLILDPCSKENTKEHEFKIEYKAKREPNPFHPQKLKPRVRPRFTSRKNKRTPLPAHILHQVQLRDGRQCSYHNHKGQRCDSRRFLENSS